MAILDGKNIMLVGVKGAKILKTEYIGQDENGGNIYEQTFDDGTKQQFTAPVGQIQVKRWI